MTKAPRYTLSLTGPDGKSEVLVHPPSSTEVIKAVMGASAGGMGWWGFKLGLRAAYYLAFKQDPPEEMLEATYEKAKASPITPNKVRDERGDSGTAAHAILEALAKDGTIPPGFDTGYNKGVKAWWDDNMFGWDVMSCEQTLIHVGHKLASEGDYTLVLNGPAGQIVVGAADNPEFLREIANGDDVYVGTLDLLRRSPTLIEVADVKTHKGAARFEDHIQVASYDLALQDMGVCLPSAHRIILARPDGTYVESTRYVKPEAFLSLLQVYRYMQKKEAA